MARFAHAPASQRPSHPEGQLRLPLPSGPLPLTHMPTPSAPPYHHRPTSQTKQRIPYRQGRHQARHLCVEQFGEATPVTPAQAIRNQPDGVGAFPLPGRCIVCPQPPQAPEQEARRRCHGSLCGFQKSRRGTYQMHPERGLALTFS